MDYAQAFTSNTQQGTITITAAINPPAFDCFIIIVEIKNGKTVGAYDNSTGQDQSAAPTGTDGVTSGVVPNSGQPALVIGITLFNGTDTFAVGSGFTQSGGLISTDSGIIGKFEYKRIATTGNQAATFTTSVVADTTTFVAIYDEIQPTLYTTDPTPDTIEVTAGADLLVDAEDVDTGTNTLGNTVPVQRQVVTIGGLGDASGLNGRAIKMQLVPADPPGNYQVPTNDLRSIQSLEALLIEKRRGTAILKYAVQGIDPRQNYSFDGPELDLPSKDSRNS